MGLDGNRIQFTPDLMPADILGSEVLETGADGSRAFKFISGPIFCQLLMADEINRASPKTQSALLEAMQEKQVTIGETTFSLDKPFLVLATQNPVDQEGTYPLPEAQVDRFMMKVNIEYPSKTDELEVMRRMTNANFTSEVNPILDKDDIFAIRNAINEVKIAEALENYIIEMVFSTRFPEKYGMHTEAKYIQFGASPRASINLNLAAKANAFMQGRDYVLPEDIKEIAEDVLNHRIILNYEAEADNVSTRDLINKILEKIPLNKMAGIQ
jgi:MoxR-like ATPase